MKTWRLVEASPTTQPPPRHRRTHTQTQIYYLRQSYNRFFSFVLGESATPTQAELISQNLIKECTVYTMFQQVQNTRQAEGPREEKKKEQDRHLILISIGSDGKTYMMQSILWCKIKGLGTKKKKYNSNLSCSWSYTKDSVVTMRSKCSLQGSPGGGCLSYHSTAWCFCWLGRVAGWSWCTGGEKERDGEK